MVNTAHVSSSNSTLSAQKKRQDERNLKALRELSALPANRFCFECGQRGPTYVNITNGSFCCTSCSGILRGLNPPHRVKSICMATFTNEEIERIRSLGNEENSHTWLGLYSGTPPKMTNKEEFTAFLIRKYEKKEWYVSKMELEEQERLLNQAKEVASQCGTSDKSAGSSVSKIHDRMAYRIQFVHTQSHLNPPDLDLFSSDPFSAFGAPITRPTAQPSHDSVFHPGSYSTNVISSQPFSPPGFVAPPPPLPTKPPVQNSPFTSQDSDPFASAVAVTSASDFDPFADFDAKFGELSLKNSSTLNAFGSLLQVQPLPKSATITSSFPTQSVPEALSAFNFRPHDLPNIPTRSELLLTSTDSNNSDKYSALAELDQMFHHTAKSNTSGSEKPAWLPSGFSTGLPPAQYTHTFGDCTQKRSSTGFSSMPKSNTLGAIAEMETSTLPLSTTSFDNVQHRALPNSYSSISSNPFVQQPLGISSTQRDQLHLPIPSNISMNNPFVSYIQERLDTDSIQGTESTQNWNPFA